MPEMDADDLSAKLKENVSLRMVEPDIFSVFPDDESGSEYDTGFGFLYDLIACNPLYNRMIWGYPVKIFSRIAEEALGSSPTGCFLDLGCGSLAFTAKTYCQCAERPVVLVDRSIKMLRMAKARLCKRGGAIPKNVVFLHADACRLPFKENTFATVLSENLLHCLADTTVLLQQLQRILPENGGMFFTTLVRAHRPADAYLDALAARGKLVSRSKADHERVFDGIGLSVAYKAIGSILVIRAAKLKEN